MPNLKKLKAEQDDLHNQIFGARGNVHMSPVQRLFNRIIEIDKEMLGVKNVDNTED